MLRETHMIINSAKRGRRVAKNLQFGGCFGCLGAEPAAAGGYRGLWANPPAAGGTGVWGRSPQRLKILHFFFK